MTGTLIVGVVLGALVTVPRADGTVATLSVDGPAKDTFSLLFLFALGIRLGPQFVAGLKGTGAPQALFAVVLAVVGSRRSRPARRLAPRRHRRLPRLHPRRAPRPAARAGRTGPRRPLRHTQPHPARHPVVDRLVADSRDVALNHTAGLSQAQQVQMLLFAAYSLLDDADRYKHQDRALIRRRLGDLLDGTGITLPDAPRVGYYEANYELADSLFRLARQTGVIALDGGGFDAPPWSIRLSIANLRDHQYTESGRAVRTVAEEYLASGDPARELRQQPCRAPRRELTGFVRSRRRCRHRHSPRCDQCRTQPAPAVRRPPRRRPPRWPSAVDEAGATGSSTPPIEAVPGAHGALRAARPTVRVHFVRPSRTSARTYTASGVGLDLHLDLRGPRLKAGLTDALRDAVRSGRLATGSRLPATRVLAADLGIARSTVTECYTALVEEGWLVARPGSGTRVAARVPSRRTPSATGAPLPRRRSPHGLEPGAEDYAEFPRTPWLAAARRAFATAPHSTYGYGDPLGRMELREALAEYLARARGVHADAAQIVITSGFHHGLGVLARALTAEGGKTVAVESYGLDIYRELLRDEGVDTRPVDVDEYGARVDQLVGIPAAAVLLTPAHQFPTGYALSPQRRTAVVDWARSTGGVILEDDYDGEFRYDRVPVGALQGLDPDHVVYFGTASKSVAPALRLGWAVVPGSLLPAVSRAKGRVDTVSVLDQLVFAEFLGSGAFDRHVRSRRRRLRRRREVLIETIANAAPAVHVIGMAAGLQAVLTLPAGSEERVLRAAERQGLAVSGLAQFRHPAAHAHPSWRDALVVNFSNVSESAWPSALQALCCVLPSP